MKKLIIIALAIVATACVGPQKTAQINDTKAVKRANIIIVHTDQAPAEAYKDLSHALLTRGYPFRFADDSLKTISTEFIDLPPYYGNNIYVRVAGYVRGQDKADIVLRGWYTGDGFSTIPVGRRIRKAGLEGSQLRAAWRELYLIAKGMKGEMEFQTF